MRFNVTRLPDNTPIEELPFSQTGFLRLKDIHVHTVDEALSAFENRTIFSNEDDTDTPYDIALTICNSRRTKDKWEPQYRGMDEDDAVETWLNAALLLTSEKSQKVLRRFSVRMSAQLGYILNEKEYETVIDMAVKKNRNLPTALNKILEDIYAVLPAEYELNIRGQFAAETYDLEIKDVFSDPEFEKLRTFCACLGVIWIEDLDGFAPRILKKYMGVNQNIIDRVTDRCREIERGEALRYVTVKKYIRRSDEARTARRKAANRRRKIQEEDVLYPGILRNSEFVEWKLRNGNYPHYLWEGNPVAFSYCDEVYLCCGWNDLLIKLLRFLHHISPQNMEETALNTVDITGNIMVYPNNNPQKLWNQVYITPSIAVELKYTPQTITEYLRYMLEKLKFEMSEFSITSICTSKSIEEYMEYLQEMEEDKECLADNDAADNDDTENDYVDNDTADDDKDDIPDEHGPYSLDIEKAYDNDSIRKSMFEDYLHDVEGYEYYDAMEKIAAINVASEWAKKLCIISQDFFVIKSTYELIKGCETLLANSEFARYDRSMGEQFTDAIEMLIEFCFETE